MLVGTTVSGYPAPSLSFARMPGALMLKCAASLEVYESLPSVMPLAPSIVAAPRVTVAQAGPLAAPLPQYVKLSPSLQPLFGTYVKVPFAYRVIAPLAGAVATFTPYTLKSFAMTPLYGSETLSVWPAKKGL